MKKLALPKISGNGKDAYSPQHIICLQADGAYTHLYKIISAEPGWVKLPDFACGLGCFEKWLHDCGFQRLNKSVVANLEYVTGWENEDDDTYVTLQYNCCGRIKLSPNWSDEFFSRLLINP